MGTVVNLVQAGSYSGSTPGQRVNVLFDDDAISGISGTPTTGIFSPVGALAGFNSEELLGNWTLNVTDTVGSDPLSINAWGLDVTTSSVPEPASLALLGLSLAGMTLSRKKKIA